MDTFEEQLVKQNVTGKHIAITIGAGVLVLLLNAAAALFLPILLVVTVAGGMLLMWILITSGRREVEYSVTNGEIDIDQIINQSRRKRLVQVKGAKIDSLLPVTPARLSGQYDRVVMAAQTAETATWCFTYHSKQNGKTLVLFQPNDRVLAALKAGLPRLQQMETDRAQREQGQEG
ncbi:MAG: hypothetical protein IJU16_00735 [Clostridia bacterium]|nr:hypothetical protein [Clostridia bacterium]